MSAEKKRQLPADTEVARRERVNEVQSMLDTAVDRGQIGREEEPRLRVMGLRSVAMLEGYLAAIPPTRLERVPASKLVALDESIPWDPKKHPRNARGKWEKTWTYDQLEHPNPPDPAFSEQNRRAIQSIPGEAEQQLMFSRGEQAVAIARHNAETKKRAELQKLGVLRPTDWDQQVQLAGRWAETVERRAQRARDAGIRLWTDKLKLGTNGLPSPAQQMEIERRGLESAKRARRNMEPRTGREPPLGWPKPRHGDRIEPGVTKDVEIIPEEYPPEVESALREHPLTEEVIRIMRGIRAGESDTKKGTNAANPGSTARGRYQIIAGNDNDIRKTLKWTPSDWYDSQATGEKAEEMARRQDIILRTVLLPQYDNNYRKYVLPSAAGKLLTRSENAILSGWGIGDVSKLVGNPIKEIRNTSPLDPRKVTKMLNYLDAYHAADGTPPNKAFEAAVRTLYPSAK
jgi:hypothetical protein